MKLSELVKTFKHKYAIRIVAGVLTVALVGGSVGAYRVYGEKNQKESTETAGNSKAAKNKGESKDKEDQIGDLLGKVSLSDDKVDKEEVVYIISDASGKVEKTIVSDHLYNESGKDVLTDRTNLSDIKNVKGDEAFTQDGDTLTWQADGKEIYYQGTTSEELPVSQKVTYYLDGKEISPEELAGKSGKVTIRYDYTNHTSYTETVNGTEYTVCVPFAAMTTMILDDSFSNIVVTNGKLENMGDGYTAIGYALPGLKESLAIKDEDMEDGKEIPEYFELTADVENFELSGAMTVVVNAGNYVTSTESDSDSLDDTVDELGDAANQLEDGSGELADGAAELKDGAAELKDGAAELKDGAKELSDGMITLDNGLGTLQSSLTKEFAPGIKTLKNSLGDYLDGAEKINDGLNQLSDSTGDLKDGVTTLNSSAKTISDGIATLDKTLKAGLSEKQKKSTKAAADKAVEQTFQSEVSEGITQYEYISNTAADEFYNTLTADTNIDAVSAQLVANEELYQVLLEGVKVEMKQKAAAGAKQQAVAQVKENIEKSEELKTQYDTLIASGYTEDAVIELFFTQSKGMSIDEFANAYADDYVSKNAETTVKSTLSSVADSVVKGIAAQSKDSVGEAVASTAETAAKSAAEEAAVTGANEAMATVAASIETKQKSGYSLVTGSKALSEGTQELVDSMPELTKGIHALVTGSNTLVANDKAVKDGLKGISDGTDSIVTGVSQLSKGSEKLSDGSKALSDGTVELSKGSVKLADGTVELSDGAKELSDGMKEFNEEGIEEIVNSYTGDIKPLVDRLQAVLDAGAQYQSFTSIADGSRGEVKFIYKMDGIEAEEADDMEKADDTKKSDEN